MRTREAATAFALGFAAGIVVLAAGLYFSGSLRLPFRGAQRPFTTTVSAAPAPPIIATAPPNLNPAPISPPPFPLPVASPHPNPVQGEAARTDPNRPIVPVGGISPDQLRDSFHDKRDGRTHDAIDIPAARGTPVVAAVEGNVVKLFHSKAGGITVYQFDDPQSFCYYYAHLDRYAPGLKEGTLLRQGQVLGYVGTTGNAPPNAPHLHFEVHELGPDKAWWKGTALDPLPLLK